MNPNRIRILLLDDDPGYRLDTVIWLRDSFQVDEAADGRAALDLIERNHGEYDVALIDQHLATGLDGISVLSQIRQAYPEIEGIVLTGYAAEDRERAVAAGAFGYVDKNSASEIELLQLIRNAAEQARLRALSRDILSRLDSEEALCRRILSAAASLLEADEAALTLCNTTTGRWRVHCLSATDGACEVLANQPLAEGIRAVRRAVWRPRLDTAQDEGLIALGLTSLAAAPISGQEGVLGVLIVYSRRPDHFSSDRPTSLQTLATWAGLALDNTHAYQKSSDLTRYLRALLDANIQLAQETDPLALGDIAWKFVRENLAVDTFLMAIHDEVTDQLTFPVMRDGGMAQEATPFRLRDDNGLTAHVIAGGVERYWPTLAEKREYCATHGLVPRRRGRESHSCLFLPLHGDGRVLGALSIQAYDDHAFSEEARAACRALASQLASALANARLKTDLRDKADDLNTLQVLARDIASSLDMAKVGGQTCAAAKRFFNASHSGLLEFGADDEWGVVTAEYPPGGGALGLRILLRDVPDEQFLMRERLPLAIPSVAQRETLGPVREILLGLRIRATLIVPVIAADSRLLGSFSIDFAEERPFDEDDVAYAQMFAAWAAIALDHAHVYRDSQRKTELLDNLEQATRQLRETDDPQRLRFQVVRGAREVMGCGAGCLILVPPQQPLQLVDPVGLGDSPAAQQWLLDLPLVGRALGSGQIEHTGREDGSSEDDSLLRQHGFRAAVAAPLMIMNEVSAILVLLDTEARICDPANHDILSRYVDQAVLVLRTSQAMSLSQRSLDQNLLLHKINLEIRDGADLRDTLHMVVTAVTANYGLQLNCAALWLLEEDESGEPALIGHTGIGHLDRQKAQDDYEKIQQEGRGTFAHYYHDLKAGVFRRDHTPLHEAVAGLRVPLDGHSWLRQLLERAEVVRLNGEDVHRLPQALSDVYRPGFPLLLAPLVVNDRALGLLMADNRIINAPIGPEVEEPLRGLAAAAAVAINNDRLRAERERQLMELRDLAEQRERVWRASTAVAAAVVQEELEPTLNAIAASLAAAVGADAVTVYAFDAVARRFTHRGAYIVAQRVTSSLCLPENIPPGSLAFQIIDLEEPPYWLLHDGTRSNTVLMQGKFVHAEGIQATIGLQLRSRGECIGVMFVNYRMPHDFDERELDSIRSFANQAAAAIYGQKQYRAATHNNRQLAAVHQAALNIGDAQDLDETLSQIAKQALKVVDATDSGACHVALLHGNSLQFRAASSEQTLVRLRAEVGVMRLDAPRQPSIIARVARSGQSENLPDATLDPDYWPFDATTTSQMAVVIKRQGAVIGVINLEHPTRARFTDVDMVAIDRLAALAGASIRAAEDRRQLETIARISREVNTCQNLDEFLQAIYNELDIVFREHEISIRLSLGHHEPEAGWLRMRRIPTPPGDGRLLIRLDDEGIIPHVAATRQAYYAADVNDNDPYYYRLLPDTASEFAVPVNYQGELLAVLDVQSTVPNAFSPGDQDLLKMLAVQVATTIHNLNQKEELEKTQRKLRKRATLTNYSLITNRWSHDIRQVARNIIEYLDVMELDLIGAGIAREHFARHKEKITALANKVRVRQPIKTDFDRRHGIRRLPANELLRRITDNLLADWTDSAIRRHIHVSASYSAPNEDHIAVDEEEFRWIVENILDNAGRYLRGRADARIEITTQRVRGRWIEFSFGDNGPGIDLDRLPLLFEEPIRKASDEPGAGICLYNASAIIEEYGGQISARNRQTNGALFTLLIPVAGRATAMNTTEGQP